MRKIKVLISFDLPNFYVEKIRSVSPNLDVIQSRDKEEALLLVSDADILFVGFFSLDMFLAAKKLRWIQAWGAGVDRLLFPQVIRSRVIVTNAGGVHPTPVSEHAIGLMLCFGRKFHLYIRNQSERRWERYGSGAFREQVEELSGKTVGIVGLGRIGTEIAKKAKCLGMRVVATKRHPSRQPSTSVDLLIRPSDLKKLLAESDFHSYTATHQRDCGNDWRSTVQEHETNRLPYQRKQRKNRPREQAN
jgi:D-2-hydroxyacid dehydrogenase (NADP+)